MRWYRNLNMTSKIVLPVGLMLIVALSVLTWQVQSRSSAAIQHVAERELAGIAGSCGNAVKNFLEMPLSTGGTLAATFGKTAEDKLPMSREAMMAAVRGMQRDTPDIIATGIGCEPNAIGAPDADFINTPGTDATGRFLPYIIAGEKDVAVLEEMESSDWYMDVKRNLRPLLTAPYAYPVGDKTVLMTTASSPIKAHNKFIGMVGIDISLERISALVGALDIYSSGFGAVIAPDGSLAAHKDASLAGKSIFDTDMVENKDKLKQAMRDGRPFSEVHAGLDRMTYAEPIKFFGTGQVWYAIVTAPIDEVLAEASDIRTMTVGISAVVLLLSLMLITFIVRMNVKPLGTLADAATAIAGGNLNISVNDEHFGGEVRVLSSSIREMITSLIAGIEKANQMSADAQEQTEKARQATRDAEEARKAAENAKREGMLTAAARLEDVVGVVSRASRALAARIDSSEQGSSEQAALIAETATAMEQMTATIMDVARNAGAASEMVNTTKAKAEEGSTVVHRAVSGIQDVQKVSLALKNDMSELAEQAKSISTIMAVISDIADQTNLLALNAAIEAARAGEAGRGFAVVADEVRKLAEKTMTSTKDVGDSISTIQHSVDRSIRQVDHAAELIGLATEQSNSSGDSLQEIVKLVEVSADQVRAIAAAGEEQSVAGERINSTVGHINTIAEKTAQTMHEAAEAVMELNRQAEELSVLLQEMKNA